MVSLLVQQYSFEEEVQYIFFVPIRSTELRISHCLVEMKIGSLCSYSFWIKMRQNLKREEIPFLRYSY